MDNKMKNLNGKVALLVGSSFSAAPILFALKKYGLKVAVCGNLKDDPCHAHADESYYKNYANVESLDEILESNKFDYVVPSCNDLSYMGCAALADKYNLKGFDGYFVSQVLHTKDRFRQLTRALAIPSPAYISLSSEDQIPFGELNFPLLVKPVDSFSGRGMTKVQDEAALTPAIELARTFSKLGLVVLEEFVEGGLHSHSAFIQDGKIVTEFFVDEYCTVYPYQVNCSNHPSFLPESIKKQVAESMAKVVSSQNLTNGLLHTQFISNGDKYWIIETMRRCPGDLFGDLVRYSNGADYTDMYIRPFIGHSIRACDLYAKSKYFGRHTVSSSTDLINYSFSHSIPSENVSVVQLKQSGEKLLSAPFDKLSILFSEFKNEELMRKVVPNFTDYIKIQTLG